MGKINDYASTKCPLFGEGHLTAQKLERFDFFGPIYVGKDDTGYDVKFFGAASDTYMEWDEDGLKHGTSGGSGLLYIKKTFTPPATGYEDTVRINSYPTMVSGATTRGLQVLSECLAGTGGSLMTGITAIAEQDSTKHITGEMTAGCFSLINAAPNPCDMSALELTWKNTNASGGTTSSYIRLREYSGSGTKCRKLFRLYDASLADGSSTAILTDTATDQTNNVLVRCSYGGGSGTVFWLMGTTGTPD